jgi:hypothetical protein
MERCDDSYGLIGEVAQEALFTYARLPFKPTGIAAAAWCEDLCELLVWEDWGLLHRQETRPFAQIHGPLADHAERFLLALADELRAHRLRHQADQALENIAYLHIAAGRLTSFAPAAAKLGSHRWMPIVALAQAAIARGRNDIARHLYRSRPARPPARLPARAVHRAHRHPANSHISVRSPTTGAIGASTVRVPVYASRRAVGRQGAAA